ncbi:MAG: fructose-bisphosphate aldolase, partial [Deltaproteobacteria bacterium]|nr:fructose-bisphosphate aldolase [Deltaproteobacteria bacterium]
VKLGADAVSIHMNIGDDNEKDMLKDFGRVSYEARTWGVPLLAMVYPRGKKIKDEYDVKYVKHAARVGDEMGADIVKVSYTGSPESFREVVAGCSVPVVIAGGEKMDSDKAILEMVKGSIDAGGSGVSIGRNVFQHKDPTRMVQAISLIVNENGSVAEALEIL